MVPPADRPTRREFLARTLPLGATALLAVSALPAGHAVAPGAARTELAPVRDLPSRVFVQQESAAPLRPAFRRGDIFSTDEVTVTLTATSRGVDVKVACPRGPLSRVVLRWPIPVRPDTLWLGDHWERGYGDLQWRHLQPERVMPWYCAGHAVDGHTFLAGVGVQPAALCFWTADADGLSLWLDFRNGGNSSWPGERKIAAATILSRTTGPEVPPFAALAQFCRELCPAPRLAAAPVCGNNNWYYAYGRDFDAAAMRRDAAFLAELAAGHPVQPYCVIDAGWTPGSVCPGGPWTAGDPVRFPDLPGLAADLRKAGVRPGIWVRPTALTRVDDPGRLRAGPVHAEEKPLDVTRTENLALIHDDVARIRGWGFDLIKHDFSSYDIFGRWGFDFGAEVTDSGWNFHDRSLTNAEIILRLYRTLRDAAGDAVLLGCNTIGHLGAGLFEVQRAGDDTSGRVWERTRRMGINTLAFRLPQHRAFFTVDADCAAHTEHTPWEFDRQFLDLVARSGTALFISTDPRTVTPEQRAAFARAMQTALSGGAPGGCEPLDWLHTTAPRSWRIGGETVDFAWEEAAGAWPMRV